MTVTLFGGYKGGTGKSTLATNYAVALARAGRDVLLVDTDKQGSADGWASTRAEAGGDLPRVHCVQKFGDVAGAVRDLRERYHEIVIDAGGRDGREFRSAMLVANAMFVPLKASQFDLWTMDQVAELIDHARGFNPGLQAWAVLSMAPTHPQVNETAEARELLEGVEGVRLAETVIRERKAYREATSTGRGVLELHNPKAAAEIAQLSEEIRNGF
jgi:chromosome partitioning protein